MARTRTDGHESSRHERARQEAAVVAMRALLGLGTVSWACALQSGARPVLRHPASRPGRFGARLFAGPPNDELSSSPLAPEDLLAKARDFLRRKNAAGRGSDTLEPIFGMCSPEADVYGLRGESIRPGLTAFFEEHAGLRHELLSDPEAVGPNTVQYPFVKTWGEGEDRQSWSSIDLDKPRNKVERLDFDAAGNLVRVSVVEADAPLEPLDA